MNKNSWRGWWMGTDLNLVILLFASVPRSWWRLALQLYRQTDPTGFWLDVLSYAAAAAAIIAGILLLREPTGVLSRNRLSWVGLSTIAIGLALWIFAAFRGAREYPEVGTPDWLSNPRTDDRAVANRDRSVGF
jgi:hypothetical protein